MKESFVDIYRSSECGRGFVEPVEFHKGNSKIVHSSHVSWIESNGFLNVGNRAFELAGLNQFHCALICRARLCRNVSFKVCHVQNCIGIGGPFLRRKRLEKNGDAGRTVPIKPESYGDSIVSLPVALNGRGITHGLSRRRTHHEYALGVSEDMVRISIFKNQG